MSVRLVHRSARMTPSPSGPQERQLQRPPAMPEGRGGLQGLLTLVPLLGAGASMTVMMLFRGSSLAAVGALMMIVTLVASLVMVLSQRGKATRARIRRRESYLAYLERTRAELRSQEPATCATARDADPHPTVLHALVREGDRLWERRRGDEDFLQTRLGTGEVKVRRFIKQGDSDELAETDEFMHREMELLERRFTTLNDLPVRIGLDGAGHVSVVGDPEFGRRVVRLLLAQAATFTSPEDLHLAAAIDPSRRQHWDWLTWLPHLADQRQATPLGPLRRVAPDLRTLDHMLREDVRRRMGQAAEARRNFLAGDGVRREASLIVVLDLGHGAGGWRVGDREHGAADLGLTVVHLVADRRDEPEDVRFRITQEPESDDRALLEVLERRDAPAQRRRLVLDALGEDECTALSRELAGLRLSPDSLEHDASSRAHAVTTLLEVADPEHLDIDRAWAPRPRTSFLRVPVGEDDDGQPVMLDLKEAAHLGMGPHGLCVGATGSGKSEFLRMLVLALLSSHGPDDLAMVLVDYKGGATFAPFAEAPQVSGVITNLSDDATLVERVYASLSGEVERRQQVLRDAGNLSDITAYRRARRERMGSSEALDPLPHLLVVIDEFGELLTARPDFIELFLSIGRIGRSIGVHLLLSSQRIEGGKLRGLDTYLSYRIGLRTLSESESRTILDTPDAFALPALPGYGYLKVDTTIYTRFRSGYVSGPLADDEEEVDVTPQISLLPPYGVPPESDDLGAGTGDAGDLDLDVEEDDGPTLLSTMVEQLATRPTGVTPVWLPPLPRQLTLDEAGGAAVATTAGLRMARSAPLRIPMGRVDDPRRQAQGVWELDLGADGGHVLVIGGPRTGRTTFLRTVVAAAALTHGPEEVVVYALDLLGSSLQPLDELPNVAGVGVRSDREVVRRTVEEVRAALLAREDLFHEMRLEDLTAARRAQAEGRVPASVNLADVVVVIDGFGQLGEEFENLEPLVRDIVRRGAGLGMHVVATVSRWNEVRLALQSFFATKLELRLGDPSESNIGRRQAESLRDAPPGRLLLPSGKSAQVALPRVDGVADRTSMVEGLADLIERSTTATTARAPRVRLLPPVVRPEALVSGDGAGAIPIGLSESTLGVVALDLDRLDRHVVAIGDSQTGRTSLLRLIIEQLINRHGPDDLVFAVIDPRGGLRGVVPEEYLGAYAGSTAMAERLIGAVLPELSKRSSGAPEETDARPGPKVVIVADDYEVVTAGGTSPLQALVPYIAMAGEIDLHVLLARRTAGAARGVFEPVFAAVRDSGGVGLLFSGDRGEGQLLGSVRPARLPVGRAQLVRGGEAAETVQIALVDEGDTGELEGHGFAKARTAGR